MIVKGKLITCKREVKKFNGKEQKEKLYVTLAEVELDKKKLEKLTAAFTDAGKKFTPEWVKNFQGYVNLATEFELPYMDIDGNKYTSIELDLGTLRWMGAEVEACINIKEGAIYPVSLKFVGEGKAFDPFAEFENMDED